MAKPIFLIKVNALMSHDRQEQLGKRIEAALKDEYHVLVAGTKGEGEEAEFQLFNVDTIPESTIEEIKKIAMEANA